jgi:hypothetical protein
MDPHACVSRQGYDSHEPRRKLVAHPVSNEALALMKDKRPRRCPTSRVFPELTASRQPGALSTARSTHP